MARKSAKEMALAFAVESGIELSEEYGSTFGLEIWGREAHKCIDPGSHVMIMYVGEEYNDDGKLITTEAGLWACALKRLKEMEQCKNDCDCYGE